MEIAPDYRLNQTGTSLFINQNITASLAYIAVTQPLNTFSYNDKERQQIMNKDKLIEIMDKHDLDRYQVADLVGVRKSTVDTWFMNGKGFRNMPDNVLDLLELKIKPRK